MTHSNHRIGTYENLNNDFVVLAHMQGGKVPEDIRRQWATICLRHEPVHGNPRVWEYYVFDSKDKITNLLKDLAAAELGLSITVSGIFDQVWQCCREAGTVPHSVNQSLGFLGATERLPHRRILEFTTMCGHGKVSPSLVWYLADRVIQRSLTVDEAALEMGKPCLCDIFNTVRAAALLRELVADLKDGKIAKPQSALTRDVDTKTWGMRIDEEKCIGCLKCIPYCPMSAIVEKKENNVVAIDPKECVECDTCFRVGICPTDAIVPGDLAWPQVLRSILSDIYSPAPYNSPIPPQDPKQCRLVGRRSSLTGLVEVNRSDVKFEVQTNDVSGKYAPGYAGIIVEVGRPAIGASMGDVGKVTEALASLGVGELDIRWGGALAVDKVTGKIRPGVAGEKVSRFMVELRVPLEQGVIVLQKLREVAREVNTVFSINLISPIAKDGSVPTLAVARGVGMEASINGKTNIGLGRPLVKFF